MPAAVTLSTMRTQVREIADQETLTQASAAVTNAKLDRAINRNLEELYGKLLALRGDDYYAKSYSFSTAANVALYDMPADFLSLLDVSVNDGYRELPMEKFGRKERAALKQLELNQSTDATAYRYRLVGGNKMEIRPQPTTTSHTVTIEYVPTFVKLVNDNDTFDGVAGWELWAYYGAAIDLCIAEESYEQANAIAQKRATLDAQINTLAGSRDAASPEAFGDTLRDWSGLAYEAPRDDWWG